MKGIIAAIVTPLTKAQTILQITFVSILLIVATLTSVCVFQKGGVDDSALYYIGFTVLAISGVILYEGNIKADILYILLASPVVGILALVVQYKIVQFVYDDKTWFLWENPGRLVANFPFYGTIATLLFFLKRIRRRTDDEPSDNN